VSLTCWLCVVFHADLLLLVQQYTHLQESLAAQNAQSNSFHTEGDQPSLTGMRNIKTIKSQLHRGKKDNKYQWEIHTDRLMVGNKDTSR